MTGIVRDDDRVLSFQSEHPHATSETLLLGEGAAEASFITIRRSNRDSYWEQLRWIVHTRPLLTTACLFTLGIIVGAALGHIPWQQMTQAISNRAHGGRAHRNVCSAFEEDCTDTAPFIFDSVFSLLKQWPSSYAPNGHFVVTGTLLPNVPLYHARQNQDPLPKPMYFALDPEMSVGMYGGSRVTYLYTCSPTRPLSILYLDGTSASLTTTGSLDSQFAILNMSVPRNPTYEQTYDEHARAREWCSYLATLGVDGVVRMNAGFEVMVCDYVKSGVECRYTVNITIPGNEANEQDPSLPQDPNRVPPDGFGNIFAPIYGWEWVRSATWGYGSHASSGGTLRERRVALDLCGAVTFYDPLLRSMSGSHRSGIQDGGTYQNGWGLRRGHRLLDLSRGDALTIREWIKQAVSISMSRHASCSGTDWQLTTELITDQHKSRILEISSGLNRAIRGATLPKSAVSAARALSHQAIVPYWHDVDSPRVSDGDRDLVLTRCATAYTGHIPERKINEFEVILKDAIERVLFQICSLEIGIFFDTDRWLQNDARDARPGTGMAEIQSLYARSTSLIDSLGWSTWFDCPDKCTETDLCYIPMWPVVYAPNMFQGGIYGGENLTEEEMELFWRPKCLNQADWDCGGTRGREPDFRVPSVPPRSCKYSFKGDTSSSALRSGRSPSQFR